MELHDKLESKFRLDLNQKRALNRLKLFSVSDLLFHFPVRYSDISEVKRIVDLVPGDTATIYGKVSNLKTKKSFRTKIPMAEGQIEDLSGKIKITWFNQAYLAKMLHDGESVKLTGRVTAKKNGIHPHTFRDAKGVGVYLANPEFEKMPNMPIDSHDTLFKNPALLREGLGEGLSYPIYAETRGITSKWFYHAIEKILREKTLDNLEDYIPADILKKYNLPTLKTALIWIHKPKNKNDAESARKRFAFEEVFCIQLERQHDKFEYKKNKSFQIKTEPPEILNPRGSRFGKKVSEFLSRFPFTPTNSQIKSIETILNDMAKTFPMSRLLEGDVGSGKTAVAATAAYSVVTAPSALVQHQPASVPHEKSAFVPHQLQVAYMAPTEILATQHFESFIEYFKHLPINIGLITGSGCRKFPAKTLSKIPLPHQSASSPQMSASWTTISRAQLLKWVANGEIPILIGTHALIQKTVKFKNLALVVIDEQHRFGTAQRRKLVRKDNIAPHLLSMTATPIPRTLALTIYGDLDLSLLDEMPAGRKEIITEIITPNKRDKTYEKIRAELKAGRQLYVICPRIFEPDDEEGDLLKGKAKAESSLEGLSQADGPRVSAPRARGDSDPIKKYSAIAKLEMKAVTTEAKRLKKEVFREYEIGVLHSKMSKEKKEEVMAEFSEGKIHILCATSVVEVGVNVPNATVIIIEGAERFGLAQLHQLRGRVIRSTHQAYCYIFASDSAKATTDKGSKSKTVQRLQALITAKNGFELAELDLTLRGAGELGGTKQWGITDLGMEAIKNIKMVEAARTEAIRLIESDPELAKYPLLKSKVKSKAGEFHFE